MVDKTCGEIGGIDLINGNNGGEIDCLPLIDLVVDGELEFEGVVALEFTNPD